MAGCASASSSIGRTRSSRRSSRSGRNASCSSRSSFVSGSPPRPAGSRRTTPPPQAPTARRPRRLRSRRPGPSRSSPASRSAGQAGTPAESLQVPRPVAGAIRVGFAVGRSWTGTSAEARSRRSRAARSRSRTRSAWTARMKVSECSIPHLIWAIVVTAVAHSRSMPDKPARTCHESRCSVGSGRHTCLPESSAARSPRRQPQCDCHDHPAGRWASRSAQSATTPAVPQCPEVDPE